MAAPPLLPPPIEIGCCRTRVYAVSAGGGSGWGAGGCGTDVPPPPPPTPIGVNLCGDGAAASAPLWGRVGVGGREVLARRCPNARPPPPTPPHKGEGRRLPRCYSVRRAMRAA